MKLCKYPLWIKSWANCLVFHKPPLYTSDYLSSQTPFTHSMRSTYIFTEDYRPLTDETGHMLSANKEALKNPKHVIIWHCFLTNSYYHTNPWEAMSRKVRLYSVENTSLEGVIYTTMAFWFRYTDTRKLTIFKTPYKSFKEGKKNKKKRGGGGRIPIYLRKKKNKRIRFPFFT